MCRKFGSQHCQCCWRPERLVIVQVANGTPVAPAVQNSAENKDSGSQQGVAMFQCNCTVSEAAGDHSLDMIDHDAADMRLTVVMY